MKPRRFSSFDIFSASGVLAGTGPVFWMGLPPANSQTQSEKSMPAFYKKALEKIFSKTLDASNPVRIVRNILSKLADHLVKSWIVSPMVSGVIYQTTQPLVGVPRTALPTVSIGRGSKIKYTFFPGNSSGNTAN